MMNPMMRALTEKLAKAVPVLSGVAGAMSGMNGTEFGRGGLMQTAPGGRPWSDFVHPPQQQTPNQRVNDAFGAMPQSNAATPGDQSPVDRIRDAFNAMRSQPQNPNLVAANSPGVHPADAVMIGGPQAPQPGPPMNLASNNYTNVPDRAQQPPGGDQQSPMGFFMRNAMMQRDPNGGGYLDPTQAAQAQASPFKGLFG